MNCPSCGAEIKRTRYVGFGTYLGKHCRVYWRYQEGAEKYTRMGEARKSDSQRKRVYGAENHPFLSGMTLSVREAQIYADQVWDSAWFKSHFPDVKRRVRAERLSNRVKRFSGVSWWGGKIAVRDFTVERILLHELAHQLVETNEPAHGPKFAKTFLLLMDRFHSGTGFPPQGARVRKPGTEDWFAASSPAQLLRGAFRAAGVKVARGA